MNKKSRVAHVNTLTSRRLHKCYNCYTVPHMKPCCKEQERGVGVVGQEESQKVIDLH